MVFLEVESAIRLVGICIDRLVPWLSSPFSDLHCQSSACRRQIEQGQI